VSIWLWRESFRDERYEAGLDVMLQKESFLSGAGRRFSFVFWFLLAKMFFNDMIQFSPEAQYSSFPA
jgi:hypothetical protein